MNQFFKLNSFKKNISSQYGEDGIIDYLISTSLIPIHKSSIEFGGHDGISNSNTYNLWKNKEFDALLIEADKSRFEILKKNTINFEKVKVLNTFVNIKGDNSVDEIISRKEFSNYRNLGILSIDIDSFDYYIFKYLKIKPQIIVIEFNNSIPGYIDYKDVEGELFLRCSAKALQNLGFEKGYYTVACTVTNVILLREDCFNKEKHPNLPIEYLLDYESLEYNNDNLYTIIHSQMLTTFPIFTKRINILDRLYFRTTRKLYSLFGLRKEKYIKPSNQTKKQLFEAKLYK